MLGKKQADKCLERRIVDFGENIHAELVAIEDDIYWKFSDCVVFEVRFEIAEYETKKIKEEIEKFFICDQSQDVIYTE